MQNPYRSAFFVACLLIAAAYLPGLPGPFLHDDIPNLRLLFAPATTLTDYVDLMLGNTSGMLRRPISNLSFVINYQLAGSAPTAFKLVNLVLHLVTAAIAFGLIRQLMVVAGSNRERANLVALVTSATWAAHPFLVSTVLYTVQRMTILATLFSLTALTGFVHTLRPDATPKKIAVGISVFFAGTALALASKESGALTPLLALAIWLYVKQTGGAPSHSERWPFLICIFIPIAIGLAVFLAAPLRWLDYTGRDFTLSERLATQPVILWQYLKMWIIPWPNAMGLFWDGEPIRTLASPAAWAAASAWLVVVVLAFALRKRTPIFLLGVLWYLFGHAMESTALPLEMAYEHRNYLPLLGPTTALAFLFTRFGWIMRLRPITVALIVTVPLIALTTVRATTWGSMSRFSQHEASRAPDSRRALSTLLGALMDSGQYQQALRVQNQLEALTNGAPEIVGNRLVMTCFGISADLSPTEFSRIAPADAAKDHVIRLAQSLVDLVVAGHCPAMDSQSLERMLGVLGAKSEQAGNTLGAAEYHYLVGALQWTSGNREMARLSVERSLKLAPNAAKPVERLVFIDMQMRDFSKASSGILEYQRRLLLSEPWNAAKVDRWCNMLFEETRRTCQQWWTDSKESTPSPTFAQ